MKGSKEISAIITLVLLIIFGLILSVSELKWNPEQPWPPEPEPFIELGAPEEFIEPEVVPLTANSPDELDAPALLPENSNAESQAAPESGAELHNAGKKATPPREVTTKKPSTVKAKPTPKPAKAGPSAEDKARQEAEAKAKKTRNTVKNAFAKPDAKQNANNGKADNDRSGNKNGREDSAGPADSKSSTSGVSHGRVSGGWLWPSYTVNISTAKTGSIILTLTIDRNGNVTKAVVKGGAAPASSDRILQRQCISIAKSRRFTRHGDSEPPQTATAELTFIFK